MKKILKKLANRSAEEIRNELARAHLIITLFALMTIVLLILGVDDRIVLDPVLSGVCGGLLIIIALISFNVSLNLWQRKK